MFTDLGNSNQLGFAANSFSANLRPDVIAGQPLQNRDWTPENATTTPYLNPRAFTIPAPGTFGNAGGITARCRCPGSRPSMRAFSRASICSKKRSRYLQFRVEMFNVLNASNYGFSGFQTSLFNGLNQNLPGSRIATQI
ncbi:MAG TPA: hypothetical protein VER03_08620 [Bryobacteraceae bacterium]|nr:hypothetical protein [Bryobacteraceae bacterium]